VAVAKADYLLGGHRPDKGVGESILSPLITVLLEGRDVNFGSPPAYQVALENCMVILFGEVDFIVDYQRLRLYPARREDVMDILLDWCAADDLSDAVDTLTQLEGRYIVLVEDSGQTTLLYTGNDASCPFYYGHQDANTFVSTDWMEVLRWLGKVELSAKALGSFVSRERIESPRTLFRGLYRLKPYALYQMNPGKPELLKHAFPGLHTVKLDGPRDYSIADYVQAVGAYAEHFDSFSLAFSGGTDSRLLAYAYQDRLTELLTILFEPPFASHARFQAGKASERLARAQNIDYTPVFIDWTDMAAIAPAMEHFAVHNPASTYLNAHYYLMMEQADKRSNVILSGQNGDNLWDWGMHQIYFMGKQIRSTSSHSLRGEIARMVKRVKPRSLASYWANRYAMRWAMVNSFHKPRFRWLMERYRPYGPQFEELWRYPYKAFALSRYVDFGPTAETNVWSRAGDYAGRRVILPYASPLAMHVSSQIPRRGFFDLKAPLRGIYGEFDVGHASKGPQYPADQRQQPYFADIFQRPEVMEWNQQFVDAHSTERIDLSELSHHPERAGMYELHLNHLFRFIEQQMAVSER